jgi:hypothetical protein
MINPELLKSLGFTATVIGLIGNIAVLFLPKTREKLEKSLRIAFLVLMMIGVVGGKVADHIIATANGPRDMSATEWSSFSDKMRPFSGEQFTILQYTDEVEAYNLAAKLKEALETADWHFTESTIGERLFGGGLLGVLVVISNASDEKTKQAAQALVTRLRKKRIASRWSPEPTAQANMIAIHIFTRLRVY